MFFEAFRQRIAWGLMIGVSLSWWFGVPLVDVSTQAALSVPWSWNLALFLFLGALLLLPWDFRDYKPLLWFGMIGLLIAVTHLPWGLTWGAVFMILGLWILAKECPKISVWWFLGGGYLGLLFNFSFGTEVASSALLAVLGSSLWLRYYKNAAAWRISALSLGLMILGGESVILLITLTLSLWKLNRKRQMKLFWGVFAGLLSTIIWSFCSRDLLFPAIEWVNYWPISVGAWLWGMTQFSAENWHWGTWFQATGVLGMLFTGTWFWWWSKKLQQSFAYCGLMLFLVPELWLSTSGVLLLGLVGILVQVSEDSRLKLSS